jgi:serine/threonine-protein phosphatase 2A regulatory subunit B'
MQHEQLSRAKDPNKSSKSKNKESKDGTSSPSQSSTSREAAQSPVATPSSSTTALNDPRNKPLPPNDGGPLNATSTSPALQPQSGSINSLNPGHNTLATADRFNAMGGGSPSAGGPGTPSRHGQLPPSVIISPSAPVSWASRSNKFLSPLLLTLHV